MAQVFISYSRRDLTFVEQLVSDLKETGTDVWYDLSGLEGGSRWRVEIQNAIQNSDYVIVVISPASTQSEWVEREYLFASNLKKKILPIMYRECELPMTFLNLNYIDVQGENYSRNFEKITRFLNTNSLSPTSLGRPSQGKRTAFALYAIAAVVMVLGISGGFYLYNARGASEDAGTTGTSMPVQNYIQPTSSSTVTSGPTRDTSILVQPSETVTEQHPPSLVMGASAPLQTTINARAVFIQSAVDGNMTANRISILHELSSDPNLLLFAVSNYLSPSGHGTYNNNLISVFFMGSKWFILNQDMRSPMPMDTTFNVMMIDPGENAFIHTATSSNIRKDRTIIDNELASDRDALIFAMPNWSPPDGSRDYNYHPIGVEYIDGQWSIVNQDGMDMQEGAAFNVLIVKPGENAFVHTVTLSNSEGMNYTRIDNPMAFDIPDKMIFVMPRVPEGNNKVYVERPIGVWYTQGQWAIFNQDNKVPMPVGAEFNVLILDPK